MLIFEKTAADFIEEFSGKVGELTITPPEIAFKSVEQAQPLKVIARFADGSHRRLKPVATIPRTHPKAATVGRISKLRDDVRDDAPVPAPPR